jgi:hypothetical protein
MSALDTGVFDVSAQDFYRRAPGILRSAGVPFLLGGAYALTHYTGIARHTKDLDLFLCRADLDRARAALEAGGYRTELTYEHWLAKAFSDVHFIDLIFNLGNGQGPVDESWFDTAEDGDLFGRPVKVIGPEDMVWSKLFTLDRGRYDGADVAHVLRARGERLDWKRLLARCGRHWRVLLSHLVLFGYVYPTERDRVPVWVLRELVGRVLHESGDAQPAEPICQGTLLSPTQYQVDVEERGYHDARLPPYGDMTPDQVEQWVEGVQEGK